MSGGGSVAPVDLLELTAELVDISSVSHGEAALADHVEGLLRGVDGLAVERVADTVVARTTFGHPQRLILAGHLDTVPPNHNERARIDGDTLWGLGACDMKGGDAVLLALAQTIAAPAVDVTYVFYACEEVEADHNQLGRLFADRPELVAGDAAVLAEPTGAVVEAGCQGTLRLALTLKGVRAHTARAWVGRNAIHRLAEVIQLGASYTGRRPVIDGCEYREGLQAVSVGGGVAGNVVPDEATVVFNHRFAPDRTVDEAIAATHARFAPALEDGDEVAVVDAAPAAAPSLTHPLLRSLVERNGLPVRAKLGWTDVARFAVNGIPAVNLGPGDPMLAHTADERVDRADLESVYGALADLLTGGVAAGA
ncbi:MAG: succinyl-diaminopimelate desuccinylase [Acidimicrobiales bacterium]